MMLELTGCYQERYDTGYAKGYDTGYAQGKDEGYDTGYAKGKDDGYQEGHALGHAQGQLSNVVKYGTIGMLLGSFLGISSVVIITRRWWIGELKWHIRRTRIRWIIGKCATALDEPLYEQVMSLSKRIHQVKRNIASAPQFSIGDESMKDKLEDLNKKMVKLAILLQKQKNGIAKIEQPHIIEGSISRHKELLSKETGLVRSQLENVLQQESKKLSNHQKSQERIKSYEYKLSNYHNFLDNF